MESLRRPIFPSVARDKLLPVRGRVTIEMDGEVVREMDNLYLNVGYQQIAKYLAGLSPTFPGYIAVGNGNGSSGGSAVTPAAGDTKMGFELLRLQVTSQGLTGLATVRYYVQFASTQVAQALTEVALFDVAGFNGQATAGGASSLTDANQNWKVNQWANYYLYLVNGSGVGQSSQILSNTATVLTTATTLSPAPDATTAYVIGGVGNTGFLFAHAAISPTLTKAQQPMNVIWQLSLAQS